ncbi:MAG: GNAT family N-acetyltransferase [Planctomycetota bacterium]|nr:GNAT family N-acetyltransferase [Planctomycetota bacterium]
MRVEVVHDADALQKHVEAWESLAADAIESNVFYEPWMLLPAVRLFETDADLSFVFIYAVATTDDAPVLCGFFPLERKRTFKGVPIPHLRLWRHLHCHLATPLIRNHVASETLRSFFEWLERNQRGCLLMELPAVSGDGQFLQELVTEFWPRDCYVRSFTRALLRPRESPEAYVQEALSSRKRCEVRRLRRRLEEQGKVASLVIDDKRDAEFASSSFLRLEASGWKGNRGVALACDENSRAFFTEIVEAGLERRKAIVTALTLDDRPLSMTCDLISQPGCFGFKTAFDEDYASFSPGICLTLELIQRIHARPDIEWFDSCTSAGSNWLSSLWLDKKTVTSILIPTGMTGGEFAIALFPLLHWLKGKFRRRTDQADRKHQK